MKLSFKNNYYIMLDGLKLFFRSNKKRFFKAKKYKGKCEEICTQIINDCYNHDKKYFMVSPNNFNQFYARDFGMVCEALINAGYKDKVINTIYYAMNIYVREGKVTTQISSRGKALDFPRPSPESVSYMLNSILLTKNKALIDKYKDFFKAQAKKIYAEDIDKKTGLLRRDKHYSSMKDYAKQESSCYVNCFVGLLANNLKRAGIKSSFDKYDYSKIIKKYFWRGNYFMDDLSGNEVISGDANVFPYWTGLIKDKDMFNKSLKTIKRKKLDEPFSLKYNNKEDDMKWSFINFINKDYENGTIWMHLAMCYLDVLSKFKVDELKKELKKHKGLIEKQGTMIEVYTHEGKPFKSLVFEHDEAMIWCAEILKLNKK
jgi:GH15 family glucan-1,4-alpha-glucosidase